MRPSLFLLLMALVACGKPRVQATAAERPLVDAGAPAGPPKIVSSGVPVQSSESIATNKPDPHCSSCPKGDAVSGPAYFGKPDMPLDDKTLAEVTDSVDATCAILEAGLGILEKNVKTPDKAAPALADWRKEHAAQIQTTFGKALELKARLKAAGYDQDMPIEVRPHFDERMSKIHTRLEAMRDTYRTHPAVLEAFGAFFPRGP